MTSPEQHAQDVIDAISDDMLSDIDAVEQFAANDLAAGLNRAAARAGIARRYTPAEILTFARTPLEYEPGPDYEIPPEAMHTFDEVFGDDPDDPAGGIAPA
jgi:hypothetical protein